MDAQSPEPAESRAATPTSIRFALLCFVFAIGAPIFGLMSVRDSHDGFKIFGTFLISAGIGGIAAIVGIICTLVGLARGPRTAWTVVAGILSLVSVMLWLLVLGKMQ